MELPAGLHRFGPENATLTVKTARAGAAAKAGHDLVIEVTAWQGTLEVGEDPGRVTVVVEADATSLRVREGTGGMKSLDDGDKDSIRSTIDDDVLKRKGIAFRSTEGRADAGRISVEGELELVGKRQPLAFELVVDDAGALTGRATVAQTGWGIKPYSALFGALKVADEVEILVDGRLGDGAQ